MPAGWNASSESLELRAAGIIVPVIFSLIFLLGTVGNGLVLAVLLRNGQVKYNTTNLFILNLAMADLCFIIFCVPFQATIYTLDGWLFGAFACKAVHFLIYLTMYASSFTLAAVSIDRYLAIRYPLKSRDLRTSRNAGVAIVAIWSLSLLFAGPYLSYYQIVHYHRVPICIPIWEDRRRKILDILTFVFGYLLPVIVVSLAYARTIKFLWTSVDPIERISESRKAKCKVTKMIVAVAILFCLCWLPHHLVILCFWFGHFPFNRATYVCRLASHCLSYANSCLNPIVYALISKHFRKHFKQVFTCLFFQNKPRKKKRRVGKKVHVGKGFTNSTKGFYGNNTEVTQIPERNTRKRDPKGASRDARVWTHHLQDAMVSVQKEQLEEGSLATAGHPLAMTPPRETEDFLTVHHR
ncbi:galanin receptor type 3 isoform X1 [Cuculus canorus]|uniref:galanin receptor type 3 isoform X1 n=1 Tax=Cuculus canorus TaxID=55661 RepID=UPI00051B2F9E|nr:galanin receptor type 3 isoform X1 [Cuculus canorus]XP_053906584.1 galanin receptor type 3 isoform X1 [Cuculus canorus]XP_053906591.1 galanin receptor type 3 isoform X1 [Cuculus canorus]